MSDHASNSGVNKFRTSSLFSTHFGHAGVLEIVKHSPVFLVARMRPFADFGKGSPRGNSRGCVSDHASNSGVNKFRSSSFLFQQEGHAGVLATIISTKHSPALLVASARVTSLS